MTTGTTDFMINYGLRTPIEQIPTPALALPQAAPRLAKTRADATPMNPKKQLFGSVVSAICECDYFQYDYESIMNQINQNLINTDINLQISSLYYPEP